MNVNVRAKFKCHSIEEIQGAKIVKLQAVYSNDPNSPNYSWSTATPSASLQMTITNPVAFEQFKVGEEYFLDFRDRETA